MGYWKIILLALSIPLSACFCYADDVPLGYNLIGSYLAAETGKIRNGKYITRPPAGLTYRVYSDGVELKVFTDNVSEYQTYEIYRSDGIAINESSGNTLIVPGLQARSTSGASLRQLCLTKKDLTIPSLPPLSSEIIIIRANHIIPKAQTIEE